MEQNLPKSSKREGDPPTILSTMYGLGVKYALDGIASSVHKFSWQLSGLKQGYQHLA